MNNDRVMKGPCFWSKNIVMEFKSRLRRTCHESCFLTLRPEGGANVEQRGSLWRRAVGLSSLLPAAHNELRGEAAFLHVRKREMQGVSARGPGPGSLKWIPACQRLGSEDVTFEEVTPGEVFALKKPQRSKRCATRGPRRGAPPSLAFPLWGSQPWLPRAEDVGQTQGICLRRHQTGRGA